MRSPPPLDARSGSFCVGGLLADAHTTRDALVQHFGEQLSERAGADGWVHLRLTPQLSAGERYHVTYVCQRAQLLRIEFLVWEAGSEPPTFRDPWNPAKAQHERDTYDAWITRQLGENRQFAWGTISAVFDLRSTVSFISLQYAAR